MLTIKIWKPVSKLVCTKCTHGSYSLLTFSAIFHYMTFYEWTISTREGWPKQLTGQFTSLHAAIHMPTTRAPLVAIACRSHAACFTSFHANTRDTVWYIRHTPH
jgi:hypothetical protein